MKIRLRQSVDGIEDKTVALSKEIFRLQIAFLEKIGDHVNVGAEDLMTGVSPDSRDLSLSIFLVIIRSGCDADLRRTA